MSFFTWSCFCRLNFITIYQIGFLNYKRNVHESKINILILFLKGPVCAKN